MSRLESDHFVRWVGLLVVVAVALAMILLFRPEAASAAPSPLTDTTAADFRAGTDADTRVSSEIGDGAVTLEPAIGEEFSGTSLPNGWFEGRWSPLFPGDTGGDVRVAGGELTANGACAGTGTDADNNCNTPATGGLFAPGRSLEVRATFSDPPDVGQHIGFGIDYNEPQWAMFSTGGFGGAQPVGLWARTNNGGTVQDTRLDPGIDPTEPHTYRIVWNAGSAQFFVDGELVETHEGASVPTTPLRPLISDLRTAPTGPGNVTVDWLTMSPYASDGTFTSRVLAADGRADWQELNAFGQVPAGTNIAFETRSGNSSTPNATWSDWADWGAGGEIQSPNGRYIQYRAILSTTNEAITPVLAQVEITYEALPAITQNKPTGKITNRAPTISAVVLDPDTELAKGDIRLFVDGDQKRDFSYNPDTGRLTYPSPTLSHGTHRVRIEAPDGVEKRWSFTIVRQRR